MIAFLVSGAVGLLVGLIYGCAQCQIACTAA